LRRGETRQRHDSLRRLCEIGFRRAIQRYCAVCDRYSAEAVRPEHAAAGFGRDRLDGMLQCLYGLTRLGEAGREHNRCPHTAGSAVGDRVPPLSDAHLSVP
jgi:hypothetical protein